MPVQSTDVSGEARLHSNCLCSEPPPPPPLSGSLLFLSKTTALATERPQKSKFQVWKKIKTKRVPGLPLENTVQANLRFMSVLKKDFQAVCNTYGMQGVFQCPGTRRGVGGGGGLEAAS